MSVFYFSFDEKEKSEKEEQSREQEKKLHLDKRKKRIKKGELIYSPSFIVSVMLFPLDGDDFFDTNPPERKIKSCARFGVNFVFYKGTV